MSTTEIELIKARLAKLEDTVNDILTVLNKMSTASSISRLVGHLETNISSIEERVSVLETDVEELLNDPYNEQQD